jgi:ABC-2 type transport system permease protein
MNTEVVWRLIRKEWHFGKLFIGIMTVAGLLMLTALVNVETGALRVVTLVLFFAVFNGLMWLPTVTVTNERTEQTLAFLMSLPLTVKEYTAAKLIASIMLFLLSWCVLAAAMSAHYLASDTLQAYLPLAAIVLTQALAWFCVILCVALVSESVALTSGVGILANIVFWFSFAFIGVVPDMGLVGDPVEVWNSPVFWMLPVQLAVVPLVIGATFFIQARKSDFT